MNMEANPTLLLSVPKLRLADSCYSHLALANANLFGDPRETV